jgi:acetoin utilization protein AcuB
MTFYVQGLNIHELMPQTLIFKEPAINKTQEINPEHIIDEQEHQSGLEQQEQKRSATQTYQDVEDIPQTSEALFAKQIMTSPVVTLNIHTIADEVLILFQTRQIRHFPVISADGLLVGIVSERDILHHLANVTEDYQQQIPNNRSDKIVQIMKSPVLTASGDTDVRYIARLFVEQRVGALPIVTDGKLKGIITRSDILTAVMRHFVMELWA